MANLLPHSQSMDGIPNIPAPFFFNPGPLGIFRPEDWAHMVLVVVGRGPDEVSFLLHAQTVDEYCAHYSELCQQEDQAQFPEISLPDHDPYWFGFLAKYIYSGWCFTYANMCHTPESRQDIDLSDFAWVLLVNLLPISITLGCENNLLEAFNSDESHQALMNKPPRNDLVNKLWEMPGSRVIRTIMAIFEEYVLESLAWSADGQTYEAIITECQGDGSKKRFVKALMEKKLEVRDEWREARAFGEQQGRA